MTDGPLSLCPAATRNFGRAGPPPTLGPATTVGSPPPPSFERAVLRCEWLDRFAAAIVGFWEDVEYIRLNGIEWKPANWGRTRRNSMSFVKSRLTCVHLRFDSFQEANQATDVTDDQHGFVVVEHRVVVRQASVIAHGAHGFEV